MGHVKRSLFLVAVISVLYLVQMSIFLPVPTDRDLENLRWWRRKTNTLRQMIGLSDRNETMELISSKEDLYKEMLVEKEAMRHQFLETVLKEQERMRTHAGKDTKYIVFYPLSSGFGNNLAVLAESLFVSFLTNRRFLLFKWNSLPLYYDLPLTDYVVKDQEMIKGASLISDKECESTIEDVLSSSDQYLIIRSTCKLLDQLCSDERYWPMLDRYGFILHQRLKSPMDIRKTVYSFMYNTVITLKPDIQKKIDEMKTKLHWNDYYWIGLQIRTGKMGAGDAAGHFLDSRDYDLFTRIALEKTQALGNSTKQVKWYIACDNKVMVAKLRSTYPQFFMSSSCTAIHSGNDINRSTRTLPMMCALYDSYLLSSVDEAIITARSTFGILAVNRKPKMKRVLIYKGDWRKYKSSAVSYNTSWNEENNSTEGTMRGRL